MSEDFAYLLEISINNPTYEQWIVLLRSHEVIILDLAKTLWEPYFNSNQVISFYHQAIISKNMDVFDWLLVNFPIKRIILRYNLLYYLLNLRGLTYDDREFQIEMLIHFLQKLKSELEDDYFLLFIINILCDDLLSVFTDYLQVKKELCRVINFPLNLNESRAGVFSRICNKIAGLCSNPINYSRVSSLIYHIDVSAQNLGEIIFRISGKDPDTKESIHLIMDLFISRYCYLSRNSLFPNGLCIMENHIHDPDTYKYLVSVVQEPYLNINSSVRKLIRNSFDLEDMKKGLDVIGFNVDLMIPYTSELFFGTIRQSNEKFAYIVSLCDEKNIQRIHNNFTICLVTPEASLKYFILMIIIHKKAVAKRVKVFIASKMLRMRLKKFRVLHQLSLLPSKVYYENFPGGTIYRNIRDSFIKYQKELEENS